MGKPSGDDGKYWNALKARWGIVSGPHAFGIDEAISRLEQDNWILAQSSERFFPIGCIAGTPWVDQDCPPAAAEMKRLDDALELLVQATDKPYFYTPSAFALGLEDDFDLSTEAAMMTRSACDALAIRACYRIGRGELALAWKDVRAARRMAHFLESNWIDFLVSQASYFETRAAMTHLLAHPELDAELLREIADDVGKERTPRESISHCMYGERLFATEFVVRKRRDIFADELADFRGLDGGAIDWNVVLRQQNSIFDLMQAAVDAGTKSQRDALMDKWENLNEQLSQLRADSWQTITGYLDIEKRSQLVAIGLIEQASFSFRAVMRSVQNWEQDCTLLQTQIKLAAYRVENGDYPDDLSQLGAIPNDLILGRPLRYQKLGGGYLLYSVGENGLDENGSSPMSFRGIRMDGLDFENPSEIESFLRCYDAEDQIRPDRNYDDLISFEADDIAVRSVWPPRSFSQQKTDGF